MSLLWVILSAKKFLPEFLFDRKQTRKIKSHSKNFFMHDTHFNNVLFSFTQII